MILYLFDSTIDLNNIIGIFISSLLSFLIAIIIVLYKLRKERKKEEERLSDIREYYYQCLLYLYFAIISQLKDNSKYLKNCIEDTKEDNFRVFPDPYKVDIGILPTQLESISRTDSFKIFVQNSKKNKEDIIKNYQLLNGNFQILRKVFEDMSEDNTESSIEYKNLSDKILVLKSQIDKIIAKKVQKNMLKKDKNDEDLYFDELFKISINFTINYDSTLDSIINLYIQPIFLYSIKKSHIEITHEILTICKDIKQEYIYLVQSKKMKIESFTIWNGYLCSIVRNIRYMIKHEYENQYLLLNKKTKEHFNLHLS